MRETYYNKINTKCNTTQDIIDKFRRLHCKTKKIIYQNIRTYYDEKKYRRQRGTFQFEADTFSKNAEGISKIYHEVLLLMKFLQNKPLIRSLNIKNYDLFYTVIKNRDDKETVNDEFENIENVYINFDYFIMSFIIILEKNRW